MTWRGSRYLEYGINFKKVMHKILPWYYWDLDRWVHRYMHTAQAATPKVVNTYVVCQRNSPIVIFLTTRWHDENHVCIITTILVSMVFQYKYYLNATVLLKHFLYSADYKAVGVAVARCLNQRSHSLHRRSIKYNIIPPCVGRRSEYPSWKMES